jgi:2-polyprenyl-6-methoxyphenol hydroxylase-like FAD-dependent oxidoreductase
MMLGFLLARAGVDVVVLEKHADFLRDFRGDTIHPSTLEIMHELGLLDEFLKLPHQEVRTLGGMVRRRAQFPIADFSAPADALQVHRADAAVGLPRLPRRARQALSGFHLLMQAEAPADRGGGRVAGVRADARRPARDPRRSGGRRRRPPFDVRDAPA